MSQEQFAELLQRVNEMETENKKKLAELESRNAELQRRIEEKEAGVKEWEVAGETLAEALTYLTNACSGGQDEKVKVVLIREKTSIPVEDQKRMIIQNQEWKTKNPGTEAKAIERGFGEISKNVKKKYEKKSRAQKQVMPVGSIGQKGEHFHQLTAVKKMWKSLTPLVRIVAILEEDAEGLDVETICRTVFWTVQEMAKKFV
mmetsp:Transcript_14561/g.20260  ORF Transcript_14561/g.20260 Transcript_14561/m.20260 type:complete len:202 (+) Transcript_14561:170-775(+)